MADKKGRGQACDCAILERALSNQKFPFADPPPLTQSRCIGTPPLPEQIALHRDRMWRRDEDLRIPTTAHRLTWYLKDEVMRRGSALHKK